MLTKLTVSGFKRFSKVEIELGNPVVFIGPNNSGKTSALQALALWQIGLRKWVEKRSGKSAPEKRPGVTINRRDLIPVPVPTANHLWNDLHTRNVRRVDGKQRTENIRIDILVEGVSARGVWRCGLEFDYANPESFHCRPLRLDDAKRPRRMDIPEDSLGVEVAFLPPMSGLADREFVKQPGEINFLIGQGRTAEVLRNLCYKLHAHNEEIWDRVKVQIEQLFGVGLEDPILVTDRSEIDLAYKGETGVRLDLSAAGRGLQQTLLVLAYLADNPGAVLLIDEPDAHLEILRQRQIYHLLTEAARKSGSQIIAASHSEVILNEAADRDVVIAFLGARPHRIDDRVSQLLKSLKEIGYDQYYQAEQTGWVLYLEGSTDLAILKAFAEVLEHPAASVLERPFVHYVQNLVSQALHHFYGLREAKKDLVGVIVTDRLESEPESRPGIDQFMWNRREIENYLCQPATLLRFSESTVTAIGPLFDEIEKSERRGIMDSSVRDLVPPKAMRDPEDPWWRETKASDDFLDRLFRDFFEKLGQPNLMGKTDYHQLARFVAREDIDPEIEQVLDLIVRVAGQAKPVR